MESAKRDDVYRTDQTAIPAHGRVSMDECRQPMEISRTRQVTESASSSTCRNRHSRGFSSLVGEPLHSNATHHQRDPECSCRTGGRCLAPESFRAMATTFALSRREPVDRCAPAPSRRIGSNSHQNSSMAGNCPRKISEYRIVVSTNRGNGRGRAGSGQFSNPGN